MWVLADVYESELRFVKEHMAAVLALHAIPNREFKGEVAFVDPLVDRDTRTVKVRLTFANPKRELRPEMFGDVVLPRRRDDALRIPSEAVIDSGTEKVVFVAIGRGEVPAARRSNSARATAPGRGHGGVAPGETDRRSRKLPHRLGVARFAPPCRERRSTMIKRVIRFSAENRYLIIAGTIVLLVIAWWSMRTIPLDALPDLSDTQVIVYSRWDRSPDIIEDQVTYPIITALLGAPKVKAIRGFSDFGFSYVYVIFEDGTDIVLGPLAGARIPLEDHPAAARRA